MAPPIVAFARELLELLKTIGKGTLLDKGYLVGLVEYTITFTQYVNILARFIVRPKHWASALGALSA